MTKERKSLAASREGFELMVRRMGNSLRESGGAEEIAGARCSRVIRNFGGGTARIGRGGLAAEQRRSVCGVIDERWAGRGRGAKPDLGVGQR